MARTIISRETARAYGLKRYSTGQQCKNGHIGERWTSTGACYDCVRQSNLELSRVNKTQYNAQSTQWAKDHPEARSEIFARYRAKDPERHRLRSLQWAHDNPDKINRYKADEAIRETRKERAAQWARENAQRMNSHSRKWREANRELFREIQLAYRRANQDKETARHLAYRGRLAGAPGRFTEGDIEELLERQGYRCAAPHCGTEVLRSFHCDHILPLSRGGTSWPENIQILCGACNTSKNDKTMDEWLAALAQQAEIDRLAQEKREARKTRRARLRPRQKTAG